MIPEDAVLAGFLDPYIAIETVQALADRSITALAVEAVPRTTLAQAMDALSSQANVAGYAAVMLAAAESPKYPSMLVTAAGTIPPARSLVLGVGVAGLQAIATARRLGADVFAYDVRPETKEQIQSLGAKPIELDLGESGSGEGGYAKELSVEAKAKQQQLLADELAELKQELGRISDKSADLDSVQAELTRLSAALNEISSSPARQDEELPDSLDAMLEQERVARDQADALIGAEVQRLEAKQAGLIRELDTLRKALATVEATKTMAGQGLPDSSTPADVKQDSARAPAAATGEPPLAFSSTPPSTEGVSSLAATPGANAEQPFGDDSGTAIMDPSLEAATAKSVVAAEGTYALQLIGFYSWDALLKFANRSDLPARLYYREEVVQGRAWFALIHSIHEGYASASAQLENLSPELVAMDPWIRSMRAGVELRVLDTGSQR